jgi:hypothetical protein
MWRSATGSARPISEVTLAVAASAEVNGPNLPRAATGVQRGVQRGQRLLVRVPVIVAVLDLDKAVACRDRAGEVEVDAVVVVPEERSQARPDPRIVLVRRHVQGEVRLVDSGREVM